MLYSRFSITYFSNDSKVEALKLRFLSMIPTYVDQHTGVVDHMIQVEDISHHEFYSSHCSLV